MVVSTVAAKFYFGNFLSNDRCAVPGIVLIGYGMLVWHLYLWNYRVCLGE
jgi:hypothetical protein